jgi:3-oxoacyl-[acyl-carrier-protein] synthase II
LRQVGIYGWGIVAPRSPDIESFTRNLESTESWLTPFNGFGPDNFLVGEPAFDLERYRPWIEERFPPNRIRQLESKMDPMVLYAVGSFIQALEQNPGVERVLTELGSRAHVYIGTGLGALPTIYDGAIGLHRAQFAWNRFWAHPDRCPALAAWGRDGRPGVLDDGAAAPPDPESIDDVVERVEAMREWCAFWAARSSGLVEFLAELAAIEGVSVAGEVEAGKLKALRTKEKNKARLFEVWGAPPAPWTQVSTNVLWNIANTPASQVSMLGHITGLAFAPVAACSTFGVSLKLGMDAIRRGEADVVVIGATDPAPHPVSVGAFYNARVLSADRSVSKPLTGLRGTHVAGGAAVWIVGAREFMEERGFLPLGMEPVSVGVSSDADHIITPSREGPTAAIRQALEVAGVDPADLTNWDLHATATPGDYLEVETLRGLVPEDVLVTARKGTFGHGMAAGGGWELTAQYLGVARGELHPTPISAEELNSGIREVHGGFVFDRGCRVVPGAAGKLSMGIGGVNACVVSRSL